MRRSQAQNQLKRDILFICIGIILAILLSQIGLVDWIINILGGDIIASFTAGIFFTSAFTIAPASVGLVHIASTFSHFQTALFGALGAVCGDLVLFFFIRDRFTEDLMASIKPSIAKHILHSFHLGFLKWLSPILGALIIASPLPDEFAMTLMGLSKTKVVVLVPISFIMNMLGIYSIIWFAHFI